MKFLNRATTTLIVGILVLGSILLTRLQGYLLFHSIAEIFSIVIAFAVFIYAWNARSLMKNNYLLVIGLAFLFCGIIDMAHTLAFKGMGVFPTYDSNLPTSLWIASRYLLAISFLIAPLLIGKVVKPTLVLAGYFVITVLLFLSIFYWKIFPVCYIEGTGLTPFKIISEYIIITILLLAIAAIWRQRRAFDTGVFWLMIAAIFATIFSEIAFTQYVGVYATANLVGHLFKITAFYLIYEAILATGFQQPIKVLFRDLNEVNKELKKSEESYRIVFAQSPIAIELYNPEGLLLNVNPSCLKLFGIVDANEIKRFSLFDDPNVSDYSKNELMHGNNVRYQASFDFSKVKELNLYHSTKHGQMWLDVLITPIKNGGTAINGYLVQIQDITEHKQLEEALKISETNFRNSMDQSPLGKRILNTEGTTIYANQAFLDIYGYSSIEEFNSIPAKERYTPQSYVEYLQRKEKRERGEHVPPNYEVSILRRNGEVRHLEVIRKELLWDNQPRYQVIYLDVTEQKNIQLALQESEGRYRSLFENMLDGYAYCRMFYRNGTPIDFLYLDVNNAFERLTGLGDIKGKMVSQAIPGLQQSNPELFETYGRVALTGQSEKFETYLKPLGIWLSVSVYSPAKEYFVAVFDNITTRKKDEDKIKSALAEKELLLKEIHHRVKNNMQVISSLLKLQAGFIKDKQDLHMFQESQQRIRSMALVYNKLYQSSNLAYINFAEYVKELAANLIRSYNLSPERITTRIEARDVELGLDLAIPCGLIINEAITNSLKYAFPHGQDGEIWINIRQNNGQIEMSLGDNGIGFPQGIDLSNIETLGLELIHTLVVHQLGGKIEIKRGRGTEYSISFPGTQKE